jgi:hypothetical protein
LSYRCEACLRPDLGQLLIPDDVLVPLPLVFVQSGPTGYTRNLTLLADPASGNYSPTSHGPIGDGLYVSFDGKAFDPATRRCVLTS